MSIFGAAMMLVAIMATLFWSFQQITEAAAQRQHIYQELDSANDLLSSLKDAETGYRGFLLTGEETFLEPYQLVRGSIVSHLRSLRQNTLIPSAQRHLDAMMPLIEAELAETARVIEIRRRTDKSARIDVSSMEVGRHLMDTLRNETSEFLKIEKSALDEREAAFHSRIRSNYAIIGLASLLAGLLAVWFGFLKHQDAKHKLDNLIHTETQRFLIALQKTNNDLESARLEAVNANNAKSDFLSSMSHELRTPLNAILGFAQLMETDSPPPTSDQSRSIKQILKAGWHLLDLINEVLDLAQIESGKAILSMEVVALADMMQDCQTMIQPQADQREIRLIFARCEVPLFAYVDRTRLKQCLINLLSNAIKYNRPAGDITVECSLSGTDQIRISIRDSGVGLTPQQLDQLFQAFNRLGQEAGDAEGTGIGLVVTKSLVELMGGTIGAESTVGVGSVFWIEIERAAAPLAHIEDRIELTPAVTSDGLVMRNILCVEDNPANLILIEQLIARRSHLNLITANNGTLGLKLARSRQPDLILLDINLPGMSGIQAMKMLRADLATRHIPVIAVSANAMPRDVEEAMRAGFFHYLTKPIKVNEFMEVLDAALKPVNALQGSILND